MLEGKPVLAIVPVRGGSKGIPRKNLYRLGKDSLLERAIKLGQRSSFVDRLIVSTDDPEMQEVAVMRGVALETLRPAHLATDNATTLDVVLDVMARLGTRTGYILLLQASSPLRTENDLRCLFESFQRHPDADGIVSVCAHEEPHPNKIQVVTNGYLEPYLGGNSLVPRQSLPSVYRFNGAFYLVTVESILIQHTLLPKKTIPFIMPPERSINLDTMMDIQFLESLVERNIVTIEEYED